MSNLRDFFNSDILPKQQGHQGKFLSTDGGKTKWVENSENGVSLVTTPGLLIENNSVTLPHKALGDIIYNRSLIFEENLANVFIEVTCHISSDKSTVFFDSGDNLNGKLAVVSYLMEI